MASTQELGCAAFLCTEGSFMCSVVGLSLAMTPESRVQELIGNLVMATNETIGVINLEVPRVVVDVAMKAAGNTYELGLGVLFAGLGIASTGTLLVCIKGMLEAETAA